MHDWDQLGKASTARGYCTHNNEQTATRAFQFYGWCCNKTSWEQKRKHLSIALLNSINQGHNGNAPAPRHSIWKVVSRNRIIRTVTVATLSKKKKKRKKEAGKHNWHQVIRAVHYQIHNYAVSQNWCFQFCFPSLCFLSYHRCEFTGRWKREKLYKW